MSRHNPYDLGPDETTEQSVEPVSCQWCGFYDDDPYLEDADGLPSCHNCGRPLIECGDQ